MTLSDEYAAAHAEVMAEIRRRLDALERHPEQEVAAELLALLQPRVVVCGQVSGQSPASRHAAPCEGLIAVDVATRRLLVCAGGRWWQVPLKPAAPFDDIDPALESALAAITAREAPLKPADTED